MKVKKFVANNMQEAMWMVKTDLGKDALIIHTRKFKQGGVLGLFGKDMVEVTAAAAEVLNDVSERTTESLPNLNQIDFQVPTQIDKYENLQRELNEVKQLITKLTDSNSVKSAKSIDCLSDLKAAYCVLTEIYELLLQNDVEKALIEDLTRQIISEIDEIDLQNILRVKQMFLSKITDLIGQPQPIEQHNIGQKKIISFVGPTGVGKTTTIAKLAAKFNLIENKDVALVTADTYRISAVSQLKKYAEIIGIPLAVVYSPAEMNSVLQKFQDKDLILVDTAGRSPHNFEQMCDLTNSLKLNLPSITYLVVSATTKYHDLLQIYENFKTVGIDSLLFTKLDETKNYGTILNLKVKTGCSLSYLTNGQNVPDDIEVADPRKIAKLVLRES